MQEQKSASQPRAYAEALADAVEKQQTEAQSAIHWQAVLAKTGDEYARRFFDGMRRVSALRAFHHNLIAQSCQRAGYNHDNGASGHGRNGKARTAEHDLSGGSSLSAEIGFAQKGRERVLADRVSHIDTAAALEILADRCHGLGMESKAEEFQNRARREKATAREFLTVVKAYDRRLEKLGVRAVKNEEVADLERSFRRLDAAERYLEEYNSAHEQLMGSLRQASESRRAPRGASAERTQRIESAEKEAITAATSYRKFQKEIESAEKSYDALARVLTGKQLDNFKISLAHQEPALSMTEPRHETGEEKVSESVEAEMPDVHSDSPVPKPAATSMPRERRALIGAAVAGIVKEMDRGL